VVSVTGRTVTLLESSLESLLAQEILLAQISSEDKQNRLSLTPYVRPDERN